MLNETPSASTKIVTALKVAALVTVLSTVVLAAEHRLVTAIPHEQTIAVQSATTPQASGVVGNVQQAATDYFPAQFPAPTGEPSEQPSTF